MQEPFPVDERLKARLVDLASQAPTAFVLPDRLRRRARRRVVTVAAVWALAAVLVAGAIAETTRLMRAWDGAPAHAPTHLFDHARGKITLESPGGIFAVDPYDPGGISLITPLEGTPLDWSADGSELLISAQNQGHLSLLILRDDGSQTWLPGTEGGIWGSFTPDGDTVVFGAFRSGDEGVYTIYEVPLDGGSRSRIAAGLPGTEGFEAPDVSPDGTRIAYCDVGAHVAVWTMDRHGGAREQVVGDGQIPITRCGSMEWSPDGTRIAFEVEVPSGGSRIYVVSADGSDLTLLDDVRAFNPSWSRDGSLIAYVGDNVLTTIAPDRTRRGVVPGVFFSSGPWNPVAP